MIALSLVIPTQRGLPHCRALRNTGWLAPDSAVEIIVADGSPDGAGCETAVPVSQHVKLPGNGIFTLRRAGIARASHDWIVVIEDHTDPLPGLLESYRDAIGRYPEARCFSGGVTLDERQGTLAEIAAYIHCCYEHWPVTALNPRSAAISNVALRKDCVEELDLASDGGFEFLTLARVAQSGGHRHCREATVDHTIRARFLALCVINFHNGRAAAAYARALASQTSGRRRRSLPAHCANVVAVRPFTIMRRLQTARYAKRWRLMAGIMAMALSHAAGAVVGHFTGTGNSHLKF